MNKISDFLRNNLRAKLPLWIMGMIVLGCILFSAVAVIPQVKDHESAAGEVAAGSTALAATLAEQNQSDNVIVLQRQIESAQTSLAKSGDSYLTQAQVDSLFNKLYDYAATSGAKIANLQAQQPAAAAVKNPKDSSGPVYDLLNFQLQVSGSVIQLMNFVILTREASTPAVAISGLSVSKREPQYLLSMTLSIRVSPFASGNAFSGISGKATPESIAVAPSVTSPPIATPTPSSTPIPTVTPTVYAPIAGSTLVGKCVQQNVQTMNDLRFSEIQHGTATCDQQVWPFKLDKQMKFVMDIVRSSGSGQYRLELHDNSAKIVEASLSSIDGRGILVADGAAGNYTLNIVPLATTGTWAYDIAIWPGLPALSFSWAQNSYSSHTALGTQSNTMTWSYTLTGPTAPYRIESTRTDGNLEYDIAVVDASDKEVATGKSNSGDVTIPLTTGNGSYLVRVTTSEGSSGSYRIALVR